MGSRGDRYDNAVAETFFATLRTEVVHRRSWPTCRELASEVFEHIEAFYNRQRRHSTLGYLSVGYDNASERPGSATRRFAAPSLNQEIK
jgi:transposase InsO family protein